MSWKSKALAAITVILVVILWVPLSCGQDQADRQIVDADKLFEANRFARARVLYQKYVSLNPEGEHLAHARYRLAECYLDDPSQQKKTRYNKAIAEFERAVSQFPNDPRAPHALYKMAVCYINIGFVQDAVIQLRRARESYPQAENSEEILLLMGESYLQLEDFSQAAVYYTTLLQSYPGSDLRRRALKGLIMAYHKLASFSNLEQAVQAYQSIAPEEFNSNLDLRFLWCESLLFTGKFNDAERELNLMLQDSEAQVYLPHIRTRLGDLYRFAALKTEPGEQKLTMFRKALDNYKQVLGLNAPEKVKENALMHIIEIADAIEEDIASYGLGDARSVLDQLFEKNVDPDYRAMILTRLARHFRARGDHYKALDYYARISQEYLEASLYNYINSEYHSYVRSLMDEALAKGDRSGHVDYYLGYGDGLELDQKERLELGVSMARVGLFDKAEGIFLELLQEGVDETSQRTISLEMMGVFYKRKDFASARKEMENVLSMSPTFREKERALLLKQKMLFDEKNLKEMQKYFLEQTPEFDTPKLRYSILHKLGVLYFINGRTEESLSYFKRFFSEFGMGIKDDLDLYADIKSATISLADLYYQQHDYKKAMKLYEKYIFQFGSKGDIAWPLKQLGLCYNYLGKARLAAEILADFIQRYPDHYLKAQVEKDLEEIKRHLPDQGTEE